MKLFQNLIHCISVLSSLSTLLLPINQTKSSSLKINTQKDNQQYPTSPNPIPEAARQGNSTVEHKANKDGKPTNSTKTGYSIKSLDVQISLRSDETSAGVSEHAEFELPMGRYSSIVRKISLSGSSDSPVAFVTRSKDILIKKTYIVSNCMDRKNNEEENLSYHYVCIIVLFDELDVDSNTRVIRIDYAYTFQNILRKNPYDRSNYLIYALDNIKSRSEIRNVGVTVSLEGVNNGAPGVNKTSIRTVPQELSYVNTIENKAVISMKKTIEVAANGYFSYEVYFPIINEDSLIQGDEYYHTDRGFFKLQLISWGFIGAIFIYMIMYIYTNEKDSFAALNVSEEVRLFNRPHRNGESAEEILLDNAD